MIIVTDNQTQQRLADLIAQSTWIKERVLREMSICDTNKMYRITVYIADKDIVEGLPVYVSWRRETAEVTNWGEPIEWKHASNGAWVNHGTKDEPRWGSHS